MAAEGHEFGVRGFTLIEDTNTHVAGSATYPYLEGWGPLVIIEDAVFTANCVMYEGDKPSTSATYATGTIIYAIFTSIDLASGTVHAQRIKNIQDF